MQASRAVSTAASWASFSRAAPSARAARSASSSGSRAARRCARSPTPDCSARGPDPPTICRARPVFSSCSSFEVKSRARSIIVVHENRRGLMALANQSRAGARVRNDQDFGRLLRERIARRADQAGVRQQARDVAIPPFRDLVRTRRRDRRRSSMRPDSTMNMPLTASPFGVSTSPGCNSRRVPCAASQASSSRGAPASALCFASRSTRSVVVICMEPLAWRNLPPPRNRAAQGRVGYDRKREPSSLSRNKQKSASSPESPAINRKS